MTETTEETIARLAKERAKIILENSDFWSGPPAAKTSAEAVTVLMAVNPPVTLAKANAVAAAIEEAPAAPKRGPKPKEQPAPTNGEPESTDA